MKNNGLLKLVYSAVIAALTTVCTLFVQVPNGLGGYIHIGDAVILMGVFLIGIYAIPAGAIGSMLADIFGGYAVYALPTIIIKALMALTCFLILKIKDGGLTYFLSTLAATAVMIVGYMVTDLILIGATGIVTSLVMNFIQAGFAIVLSNIVVVVLRSTKFKQRIRLQ